MKHSQAEFDRALAQAVGDEPLIASDLSAAFHGSLVAYRDAMARASGAQGWTVAAARMEGLAASFSARPLMRAAAAARIAVPGDARILARIDQAIADMRD